MSHLVLNFHNDAQYQQAQEHFARVSDFTADYDNDEYRAIYFDEPEETMAALEFAIADELTDCGIDGYYFTTQIN